MSRMSVVLLFLLGGAVLSAQQLPTASKVAGATKVPEPGDRIRSYDPATIAAAIQGSYYHPDELTSLNCSISVDWQRFIDGLKMTVPPERRAAIEGLKIQSRAFRNHPADLTFDWSQGELSNSEQFTNGLKQTIGGFYQLYWPMLATTPVTALGAQTKIERLPNGATKLVAVQQGVTTGLTIDREGAPTHYAIDSPVIKLAIDPSYVPSPLPTEGDLRRISSLKVNEQLGASSINYQLDLDYQSVDGFYVPNHASFDLLGAYSIRMTFTDCTASKAVAVVVNQ
jgi:hypothetical protein